MWIIKIILMAIILQLFIAQVLLLKCYICNSYKDPECVDVIPKTSAFSSVQRNYVDKSKSRAKKPFSAQVGAIDPDYYPSLESTDTDNKFAKFEKECTANCLPRSQAVGCIKAVNTIKNNVTVIHRLCKYENNNVIKGLCDEFACYSCHGDLCNSSTETADMNSKLLFLAMAMLGYLYVT